MCFNLMLLLHWFTVIFKIGICILSVVVCHWKCVYIHTSIFTYIYIYTYLYGVSCGILASQYLK